MTRAALTASARWLAAASLLCALPQVATAADIVRIGGTGMALAALQQVGASLTATDPAIAVDVLPSMGTSGGIKALLENAIEIAIAARPLNADEQAKGLREAACAATALVFASSNNTATGLTKAQLPRLYADPSPKWPDGTPLRIILRSRSGTEHPYLIAEVANLAIGFEKAFRRHGVPVGSTDQENAKLAVKVSGSLAVMTLLQIRAENLDLTVLPLDGVVPTAETLADKTYPLPIRICLVVTADPAPAPARFVAHFRSAAGATILRSLGATLVD